MANIGKLLDEVVADSKDMKELACENARIVLESKMNSKLDKFISEQIKANALKEMDGEEDEEFDAVPEQEDEEEDSNFIEQNGEEEGEEEPELDLEALVREMEGEDEEEEVAVEQDETDEEEDVPVAEQDEEEMADDAELEEILKSFRNEEFDDETGISDDEPDDIDTSYPEEEDTDDVAFPQEAEEEEVDDAELEEVLKMLTNENKKTSSKVVTENKKLKTRTLKLEKVVAILGKKIKEINGLNAKLLYTNRLFEKYPLNRNEKKQILERFDTAKNISEVKIIYSTLNNALSFKNPKAGSSIRKLKESISSGITGTSRSRQRLISPADDQRDRLKFLAGLKKK